MLRIVAIIRDRQSHKAAVHGCTFHFLAIIRDRED